MHGDLHVWSVCQLCLPGKADLIYVGLVCSEAHNVCRWWSRAICILLNRFERFKGRW
jgi:hypothetical protein